MADIVHMLADTTGSPDGFTVYSYHEGEKYVVGDPKMSEALAVAFVDNGSAELKSGRANDTKPESKSVDGEGKVLSPSQQHEVGKEPERKR